MRVLPYGDAALLLEPEGEIAQVVALADACREAELPGVLDVVPAARAVLLVAEAGSDLGRLRAAVDALEIRSTEAGAPAGTVEIPVVYDGPDLDGVARLTGLDHAEIVAAHTGTPWRVAFGGFAPGFAYLSGGDPRLQVSRREEARTKVPAGSVGLAGEFSGVYPRSSPGGWQLIGRTDAQLWDLDRDPPALLQPGAEVRFVEAS